MSIQAENEDIERSANACARSGATIVQELNRKARWASANSTQIGAAIIFGRYGGATYFAR
jgi:hypothetical protein